MSESVNNYISGINRVISETPISDSTPHNVGDLGMLCRRLERKLAATRKYLSEVSGRIQRLEEALAWYETKVSDCNRQGPEGDAARDALAKDYGRKAKEVKP